jgi:CRISPR/Cas system-associated exonuclease Cas4 (RecB family)
LFDESAIATLRELGGFTAIVLSSLERALQSYDGNPRAAGVLDGIRHRLAARVPELRSRVQRFLTRINPECRVGGSAKAVTHPEGESRQQLLHGSYAEVELRAGQVGWRGIADLLTLSSTRCEIRDFKTGASKQEHEFQLRVYALLWSRDRELNPDGRLADRLVLSYDEGDAEVSAPSEEELRRMEDELRRRTAQALADLQVDPPEARPSPENCAYCPVRHLCEEYWLWHARQGSNNESARTGFGDVQIKCSGQHGPSSWDGVVESGPHLKVGGPILLRTANLRFEVHPGQHVRLLNVHVNVPDEELVEERHSDPAVVATMGASSEVFLLAT